MTYPGLGQQSIVSLKPDSYKMGANIEVPEGGVHLAQTRKEILQIHHRECRDDDDSKDTSLPATQCSSFHNG